MDYKAKRSRAAARSKALVREGQDIGAIPPVKDPLRRGRADNDFRFFCESYFPRLFTLPWSPDHLKIIHKIEMAVIQGGLFAMAMPRGSGKTTLCQTAALWALLTGRQQFVFLIAATSEYAADALANLKAHLSQNPLLLDDYPEATYPIHKLDGESRRCAGQRYYGQLTHIGWGADEIVLPTIPGSRCSGAIVRTAGMLGNVRGAMHIRPDGKSVRPTFVVIDDPQTDQSARSASQVHERLAVVNGAILNLAGPGRRISAVMPCTVIRADDMADQILDRSKHPEWQGERTRLVYAFPKNLELWAEYARIRADSLAAGGNGQAATDFYIQHRTAMDEGAVVAWPERKYPHEVSAIQHAMNLRLRNEVAFWSEYQNAPMLEESPDEGLLKAGQIAQKVNGIARGVVPQPATMLTAFIDVHEHLLYWMVCGWTGDFTGYVLDYGSYPDQKRNYFTLDDAQRRLRDLHPGAGFEGTIHAGLTALSNELMERSYKRYDGARMSIDRLLIDANWGRSTAVVYEAIRQSKHAANITPSHGKYVGAGNTPFSEYTKKQGERVGLHWRMPVTPGSRDVRRVVFDTNYWKSFVHARLAVQMGDPGCLSLFQPDDGRTHEALADHLTSEYRVRVQAKGRTVDEWKIKPHSPDNHWLDCLVGCAVGASMTGAVLSGTPAADRGRQRMRIDMRAFQSARRM